ncbi:hypothetical protein [Actinomyces culturomici]|uniref:hypothetical protein n=1 Tax=Actinomyces culturomici TaxID=1926276 RepID=UPI001C555939|nr:hypothetical protein [Actinomyces culturomici]
MVSALKVIDGMAARKAVELNSSDNSEDSPNSVFVAARSGDDLQLLIATRDRVAKAIDDPMTPARDLAALTKRIVDITQQIKARKEEDEGDEDDGGGAEDEEFDPASV